MMLEPYTKHVLAKHVLAKLAEQGYRPGKTDPDNEVFERAFSIMLDALCDPALGPKRFVCLEDTLHFVRRQNDMYHWNDWMAEQIEREFTDA